MTEVICLSNDDATEFEWMSNEPNVYKRRKIIAEVRRIIAIGNSVPQVIEFLQEAGFKVTRINDDN